MHKETETVVRAAEAVLQRRSKIEGVIAEGVAGLSGLITTQLLSEREFRRLECRAAIGEPAPELPKAKKAAADAKAALREASLKLGGYRAALGEMGGDFVQSYEELTAEIPRHNAGIAEAFTAEWNSAVRAWQVALGRRAAIEQVIGQRLDLAEPVTVLADIGDMALPNKTLAALGRVLKRIAAAKDNAEKRVPPGINYNPDGVYKLTNKRHEAEGIPYGTFVCDASFEPGVLARELELEECRPVCDRDLSDGVSIAARKASDIVRAEREKELADSERRLHANNDENLKRSGRIPDEQNYPNQADLDKIARKNAEIAARSIGPSDPEYSGH